jgi:hypothetical protein
MNTYVFSLACRLGLRSHGKADRAGPTQRRCHIRELAEQPAGVARVYDVFDAKSLHRAKWRSKRFQPPGNFLMLGRGTAGYIELIPIGGFEANLNPGLSTRWTIGR